MRVRCGQQGQGGPTLGLRLGLGLHLRAAPWAGCHKRAGGWARAGASASPRRRQPRAGASASPRRQPLHHRRAPLTPARAALRAKRTAGPRAALRALFSRRNLPLTLSGGALAALQQLTGINAIIFYA